MLQRASLSSQFPVRTVRYTSTGSTCCVCLYRMLTFDSADRTEQACRHGCTDHHIWLPRAPHTVQTDRHKHADAMARFLFVFVFFTSGLTDNEAKLTDGASQRLQISSFVIHKRMCSGVGGAMCPENQEAKHDFLPPEVSPGNLSEIVSYGTGLLALPLIGCNHKHNKASSNNSSAPVLPACLVFA